MGVLLAGQNGVIIKPQKFVFGPGEKVLVQTRLGVDSKFHARAVDCSRRR